MEPINEFIIEVGDVELPSELAREKEKIALEIARRVEIGSVVIHSEPMVVFEYPIPHTA